ncbi:glycosyltransferase family 39 protein [Flavisphingomonas formosensis]|uniref:glycosyltransferase family 39 protein n=1 Tax=Flavisphingomonas formosensis TaxID=861534 RepID=UPI0012F82C36|nr:hypothetical protein [Sphingomonas formosensis]
MAKKLLLDPKIAWFLLALAAAFGMWLRADGIASRPLWLDEAYSAYIADRDFAFIWQIVPKFETHPPLYYSLLRLWTLAFGDALLARRVLGLIAGLATLPVAALSIREIGRALGWGAPRIRGAMLAAVALVALSSLMIEMTRLVRPYSVLILVYASALLVLIRIGRIAQAEQRLETGSFAVYTLLLVLTLWLHNLGALFAAALGIGSLTLLIGRGLRRRDWLIFFAGTVLAVLLYTPVLLMIVDQMATWSAATWLHFDTSTLLWDVSRLLGAPGKAGLLLTVLVATGAVFMLGQQREGGRMALLLLVAALLPIGVSIILSWLKSPVFFPRTLSSASVPAQLLLALGIAGARDWWRWPAVAALIAMLMLLVRLDLEDHRRRPAQDWYGAADWLSSQVRPGDAVWVYPNDAAMPLHYAAHDRGEEGLIGLIRAIPGPVPVLKPGPGAVYPTGNRAVVTLSPARLREIADAPRSRAIPRIWVIRMAPDIFDQGDWLVRALSRGRTPIAGCLHYPIDIRGFARVPAPVSAAADRAPAACAAASPAR